MNTRIIVSALLAASVLFSAGCAVDDPYRRTKTGAGVGAAAGAALGYALGEGKGAAIGAGVGALAGGAAGNYMDRQQAAFEQALVEEQARYDLELQRMQDGALKLNIPSEVSFPTDSANIQPEFRGTLDKVAGLLQEYNQSQVTIIGHTDSSGDEGYNQRLSEQRAQSVAGYLASRGVAPQRLITVGRGELEPRASNATPAGRAANRRVELLIRQVGQPQGNTYGQAAPPAQGGYGQQPVQGGYGQQPVQGGYGQTASGYDSTYQQPANPVNTF